MAVDQAYFTTHLAPLASLAMQEHHGLHGSADNYLLPSEAMEAGHECVRKVREAHPSASGLKPGVQAALLRLGVLLEAPASAHLEELAWPALLQEPAWHALRAAALEALAGMDFDLPEWERYQISA